jgi:type IV pilus assembly protein PilF
VYSQIGMEYAKLAQYTQALDALDQAVKLDPNFGMTYVYRGHIFALQGNKPRAATEYQKALEIDPHNQAARDAMVRLSGR